jgi:colanic acid/amylovoran biosynthesis protein
MSFTSPFSFILNRQTLLFPPKSPGIAIANGLCMITQINTPQQICLAGASPDTGNLGVSALCHATVQGLADRGVRDISVLDHTNGARFGALESSDGPTPVKFLGAVNGKRFYRQSNLWNIRISARLGGLTNPTAHAFRNATAILDLSGGDSFTDLYGKSRFQTIALPKLTAIDIRRPLVLLPQTYGPFQDPGCKATAQRILQNASQAWARDPDSYQALQQLLGDNFDPRFHHEGVDMAFGLNPIKPARIPDWLQQWIAARHLNPILGLNISGMLYSQPGAQNSFGLQADYRDLSLAMLRWMITHTNANIMLVPHVLGADGSGDTDLAACQDLLRFIDPLQSHRVRIVQGVTHPSIIKWYIGHTDWFSGARMHATIAAVSQGIPTAPLAYSLKFAGVFARCGQRDAVVDLRKHQLQPVLSQIVHSWCNREKIRASLESPIQHVKQLWAQQMDAIVQPAKTHLMGALK